MAFTGQIGQKANWANCFFQCVQGMLRIISIIYIIINIIYILYLLLTWNSRCAYMKMPNLLLPNLPNLPTNSGLSSTRQWRGSWWYRSIWKKRCHSGVIAVLHRRENLLKYWKIEILKNVTKPWTCGQLFLPFIVKFELKLFQTYKTPDYFLYLCNQ